MYPKETVNRAVRMFKEGKTIVEVSKELDISYMTAKNWAIKQGVEPTQDRPTNAKCKCALCSVNPCIGRRAVDMVQKAKAQRIEPKPEQEEEDPQPGCLTRHEMRRYLPMRHRSNEIAGGIQ